MDDATVLVLLNDDPLAQRLVVTWPNLPTATQQLIADGHDEEVGTAQDQWAAISGVDIDDLRRKLPLLFENHLIGRDGSVDDMVKTYIASILTKAMTGRRRAKADS